MPFLPQACPSPRTPRIKSASHRVWHWQLIVSTARGKLKADLAKVKKQHDQRATFREREWDRDQHRLIKLNR